MKLTEEKKHLFDEVRAEPNEYMQIHMTELLYELGLYDEYLEYINPLTFGLSKEEQDFLEQVNALKKGGEKECDTLGLEIVIINVK